MTTAVVERRPAAVEPSAPADTHTRSVFKDFDALYTKHLGTDLGKFWTDRYSPGSAAYANLINARNRRTCAAARGGEALLDVGSGYGDTLYMLRDRYRVLRGIDPSETTVALATHNLKVRNVPNDFQFVQGMAESLPYPDGMFDAVTMLDTYEHIDPAYRPAALAEARRVLKPGGQLIIATPSRAVLRFWAVVDNILIMRRQIGWKRKLKRPIEFWSLNKKDYCEIFERSRSLKRAVRDAGFRIERFDRTSFYPAPERGGLFHPYIEPHPRDHWRVRTAVAVVEFVERFRIFNQKMFIDATRVD